MSNPFAITDRLRGDLLAYIETAFATRFEQLNKERRELLEVPGALFQDVYIEPIL